MTVDALSVGIIGRNGSGKTTLCAYLESKGFTQLSLSSVVRNHVKRLGLPEERDILIAHANQLKEQHGLDYFAKRSAQVAKERGLTAVVYDSIRHPLELKYLQTLGVKMIGIEVPIDIRYKRICNRKNQTDFVSFEQFVAQDKVETEGKSLGQDLKETHSLCDAFIVNDSDLESMYKQADTILETFQSVSV